MGRLNLGSNPADPIIAELVALNPTEVRLGNAIAVGASERALPLTFVSEYLAAGGDAPGLFMSRVRNLGQKSASELDALVRAADEQSQPTPIVQAAERSVGQPLSTQAIREAVSAFFSDRHTGLVLKTYPAPARFTNAIALAGWLSTPFSEILLAFPSRFAALQGRPNLGRTSLDAGEAIMVRAVADELRRRGFAEPQIPQAVAAVIHDQDLALSDRMLITATLRSTATSEFQGDTGAIGLPALPRRELTLEAMTDAQIRRATAALFGDDTLSNRFDPFVPPVRLMNVLSNLGWTEQPLRAVLIDVGAREKVLMAQLNMGRVSLAAWRNILAQLLVEELVGGGFSEHEIRVLQDAVLEDVVVRAPDRAILTDRFAALAAEVDEASTGAISDFVRQAPPPAEPAEPPEVLLTMALEELDERKRTVLRRRYGFDGPRETLEEISQTYGLTRERIRQIERKALRQVRMKHQKALSGSILLHGQAAWSTLASGRLVLRADLSRRRRRLSPWFELALDVLDQDLPTWLADFGQPCGDGWVEKGFDVSRLDPVRVRLRDDTGVLAGPRAISTYQFGEETEDVVTAVLLEGWALYSGYVVQTRPRGRLRRALRLHALLGSLGEPTEVNALVARHHQHWPDDPCSARDAEIVMEMNRPLFIEVSEGVWSALGAYGHLPEPGSDASDSETVDVMEAGDEADGGEPREEMTVREAIEGELRRTGPRRISELIDRAEAYLPPGRSPLSVGPVLLAEKGVFARPLPGIYALHDQVPSAAEVLRTRPAYLFEERQIRTYVMARRAGESFGSYALWTPEVEYLWCGWARKHADTPLLEALLSIIEPDAWPPAEDADEWRALKASRGRFALQHPPRREVFTRPELDHVLAACKYIQSRRGLGWVTANRILFRRPADHNAAGLLAVLVGLGVLAMGAEDWQAPHVAGPRLGEVTELLESERLRLGVLSWSSPLGGRLHGEALAAELPDGWVGAEDLRRLLGEPGFSEPAAAWIEAEPAGSLSFLDELLADQTRRHEEERLAAVLAELTPSRGEEP